MAAPTAERLIDDAKRGVKLSAKERRHCISYLMATGADVGSTALAEVFSVTDRTIRDDKIHIRKQKAELIKEDDIGLVIADIVMCFDNQVRDIEQSKTKCRKGERTYLEHCKTIFDLQLKKVKALQELGYYPRNLGNLTVERFDYKAVVGKDGSVETRPENLPDSVFNDDNVQDAEFEDVEPKQIAPPESAECAHEEDNPL